LSDLRPIRSNRLQLYRRSGYGPMLRVVYDALYSSKNRGVEQGTEYQEDCQKRNATIRHR
jgi:hypothetical protein